MMPGAIKTLTHAEYLPPNRATIGIEAAGSAG